MPTLHTSVWLQKGCKSISWLRNGEIKWL
ncbi:DUF6527 family protein [Citrobacter portucalensis]